MATKMVVEYLICGNCYHAAPHSERGNGVLECLVTGECVHHRSPMCLAWQGDLTPFYVRKHAPDSDDLYERGIE